jgi:3',5'-cyclic AMP phosphodiesterase CpdA
MFTIALTADLHYGPRHPEGVEATRRLAARLREEPADLLILAGDIGAGDEFQRCLELFESLPGQKALVPGNHDIWVRPNDERGDSMRVYREHLPRLSAAHGFHYLDGGPLVLPDVGLAVVGSINWYDYSWAIDRLAAAIPDWKERLRTKRFQRGRHNDANYVRWGLDDAGFTREVVSTLNTHLTRALSWVPAALLVTHHPPFRGLNYPKKEPLDLDALLWEAFSGNAMMERLIAERGEAVPFAFCGHTHFARETTHAATRGINIGGDYHFKRLLRFEWPSGTVTAEQFGTS